jgi:hypothetical protein
MANWTVETEVTIHTTLTFTRDVEADTKLEAEMKAEDEISPDDVFDQLREQDAVGNADFESEAETDWKECESCGTLQEALGEENLCEECEESMRQEGGEEDEDEEDEDE